MNSSNLTRSDVIAIVIGVANTLLAHRDEENLVSEAAENEIELGATPLRRLNSSKACAVNQRYSFTELSRVLESPPPYPNLPQKPSAAKLNNA
ncbi:uncharacterized protein LAJ45_03751 [Morchella importuna]|uniref:uncharacterized protein n=1 Tax=Morchella importuna TaxID=1174673 RepID=UPI001E8CB3CE|nr:uncharacterized protein LAJ45_03751 [Morchella importuna]KAH8152324.1 hypothetical protein LAJ45_03751 [Morchella importuna]